MLKAVLASIPNYSMSCFKPEKAVQDPGKIVQRPGQEESRGAGPNVQAKPLDAVKKIGTSQEKVAPMVKEEEPKSYKSVVEGKRAVPTSNQQKSGQKVKEGEAYPSLGGKERAKEGKVVERKEVAQMGQQKTVQKLKEEDAAKSQIKTGQKEKEISKTPINDGSLDPKVHAKAERLVERKGDVEIGQKLREEVKIGLGQKKEEKYTKPVVVDDEARKIAKEIVAMNQAKPEPKAKEGVERIVGDVNGNVKSKQDKKDERMVGEKVSEGEIQEGVKQKKLEKAGLAKETRDAKGNAEAVKPKTSDSGDPLKEESIRCYGLIRFTYG